MERRREYEDIPGTYVFDGTRAQQGFALNTFLKTLDTPEGRAAFGAGEDERLERFDVSAEQRVAVRERDFLRLLELGGNIFFIWKLAVYDRRSMQYMGGQMSGMTEEEFRQMMMNGGRDPRG